MDRRSFLRAASSAAAAAGLVQQETAAALARRDLPEVIDADVIEGQVITAQPTRDSIHFLGRPAKTDHERIFQALGRSVTSRTAKALGRQLKLSKMGALGEHDPSIGTLTHTWVCGDRVSEIYFADPRLFDYDRFVAATSGWWQGHTIAYGPGGLTPNRVFHGRTFCGMPPLPVWNPGWYGHYVDEETGLCIRAVSMYDIVCASMVLRYDMVLG